MKVGLLDTISVFREAGPAYVHTFTIFREAVVLIQFLTKTIIFW